MKLLDGSDTLNPIYIVWDVLFVDSSITDSKTPKVMIRAMGEYVGTSVNEIMNWNTVIKGQKTSGAGFTSGLRFMIDVTEESATDIVDLSDHLVSFNHEFCAMSTVSLAESLPLPMDRKTRKSFPELGRIMLSVRFTHGLGYDDAKKIKNAIGTQTKETKDGLNPIGSGKGSSGSRFSEEFRSIMSNEYWFRTFPVGGKEWEEMSVNTGADGGVYELAYDLRDALRTLTNESEGVWWDRLDPEVASLSPTMVVDNTEKMETKFDPCHFHHLDSSNVNAIKNVLEIEELQTGNEGVKEDLSYRLNRMTRGRRIPMQMGDEQGLAPGLEEGIVSKSFMLPWIADEFINCLGFFLMTRKPKYWRNGKAEVLLVHPFSEDLIESLKG